jgi:hypothetical protein
MNKLRQEPRLDEHEMRAFYQSLGISQPIIEAAIELRRTKPEENTPLELSELLSKRKNKKRRSP